MTVYTTSSVAPCFQNRWLDKLGIAAAVGHKRVFRQDFVGGSYSLLDANQNPLPVIIIIIIIIIFVYNYVVIRQCTL